MQDRRNLVLFVAIAALILFGWPLAQQKFFPTANPPVSKVVKGKSVAVANPAADPTADSPAAVRDRKVVLAETPAGAAGTGADWGRRVAAGS